MVVQGIGAMDVAFSLPNDGIAWGVVCFCGILIRKE